DITCTFANTHPNAPATVTVKQITAHGSGSFAFVGTNGINNGAPFTLTTTDSQPVLSSAYAVTASGTSTTITQTAPEGMALSGAYCVDANNAFVTGVSLNANTLTIPGSALSSG